MTEEMEALGRRWAALGLEWLPGMRGASGGCLCRVVALGPPLVSFGRANWTLEVQLDEYLPDFTDPITELGLLHYVRQAYPRPEGAVQRYDAEVRSNSDGSFTVQAYTVDDGRVHYGPIYNRRGLTHPSYAAACIAALETALGRATDDT